MFITVRRTGHAAFLPGEFLGGLFWRHLETPAATAIRNGPEDIRGVVVQDNAHLITQNGVTFEFELFRLTHLLVINAQAAADERVVPVSADHERGMNLG